MTKVDIFASLISVVIAALSYVVTFNLIIAAAILVIFLLYYFFILRKKFKNYNLLIERVHTCYFFVNSFIITLSVKESYEEAFQSGTRITNQHLSDIVNGLSELNVVDKVKYLREYFNLGIYKMFLNVLDLYQDQGGNILTMSENLIRECTRTEKTLNETLSIGYKHFIEFLSLWLLSFAILIFIRFGINDFYNKMVANPLFTPLIVCYFLLFLLSAHLFFSAFTNLTIKEDSGS